MPHYNHEQVMNIEHHLGAFYPALSWQWQCKVSWWHGLLSPICCRLLWCSCGLKRWCWCWLWLWTCWWQWRKITALADYQRCWNWGRGLKKKKNIAKTTVKRKLMSTFFQDTYEPDSPAVMQQNASIYLTRFVGEKFNNWCSETKILSWSRSRSSGRLLLNTHTVAAPMSKRSQEVPRCRESIFQRLL